MRRWLNRRRLVLGAAAILGLAVILVMEISTSPEHRSANAVAFSPDGTWIAALTANWDSNTGRYSKAGRLRIWNSESGQLSVSVPTSETPLTLAFDPSGKSLVIGAWDGSVSRVETATGRPMQSYMGHSLPVRGLAFTPDGKTLIGGATDGILILWDATTGKELRRFDRGTRSPVNSMAISADGRFLAATGGIRRDSTTVWNLETGELMKLKALDGTQEPVAFAPKSPILAARVLGRTGNAQLIDVEANRVLTTIANSASVSSVAFSPDGTKLATGSVFEMVDVWDVGNPTGKAVASFAGHKSPPESTATHLGRFAMAHFGKISGRSVNPVWSVAFSPDGSKVASAGGEYVWVWSLPGQSAASRTNRALLSPSIQPGWVRPLQLGIGLVALALVGIAIYQTPVRR